MTTKKPRKYATPLDAATLATLAAPYLREPHHTDAARVTAAFKVLRLYHGFITRQNYLCCGGCAGYALAARVPNHKRPCVFYTRQDTKRSFRDGALVDDLFLTFGLVVNHEIETLDPVAENRADDVVVGRRIVEVMTAFGFTVVWDGTAERRIRLTSTHTERRRLAEELRQRRATALRTVREAERVIAELTSVRGRLANASESFGPTPDEKDKHLNQLDQLLGQAKLMQLDAQQQLNALPQEVR